MTKPNIRWLHTTKKCWTYLISKALKISSGFVLFCEKASTIKPTRENKELRPTKIRSKTNNHPSTSNSLRAFRRPTVEKTSPPWFVGISVVAKSTMSISTRSQLKKCRPLQRLHNRHKPTICKKYRVRKIHALPTKGKIAAYPRLL